MFGFVLGGVFIFLVGGLGVLVLVGWGVGVGGIGVVVVVAFTAGTAVLILHNNTSPPSSSFDYRVFAQEEDNATTTNLTNSNSTLIDFVSNIE